MQNFKINTKEQKDYDVVVVGAGTAGVFAAIAAARTGAKTAVIENKGYVGGIVTEGGCGIHSFFNTWQAFDNVEKKKVVKGIPEELFDRLHAMGGSSGHNDTTMMGEYDSDALFVDVEKYKQLAFEMMDEAGVDVLVNTALVEAFHEDGVISSIMVTSHEGPEIITGKMFIDATGYGDLAARAGADFTEPNDNPVANSMGVAGVDIDKYYQMLVEKDAVKEYTLGTREGQEGKIIRVDGFWAKIDPALDARMEEIGMHGVTVTMYDDYLMFVKINFDMPVSPTDRDALAAAELELRKRQALALEFIKENIPGSENAFITRTCPSVLIRRGRCITCEYDIHIDDILNAVHFPDDVFTYSFHDRSPKYLVKDGGTYGIPYRAIIPTKNKNLFTVGMMITSTWIAHMSTRNTVSCMGQGQAAGTAAALCAIKGIENTRDLPYNTLREKLITDNVYLEN